MIILFINCKLFPFVQWIIDKEKIYETRNKNTLQSLIGKTVYIAETGKGKKPIIRCKCTISGLVTVYSKREYNQYRKQTKIVKNSSFDWNKSTVKKCLYKLDNVTQCKPFELPDNIIRHGRIYCETV